MALFAFQSIEVLMAYVLTVCVGHIMRMPDVNPAFPRKPFNARGSKVSRCENCRLPESCCICSALRHTQAAADFWLLMHHNEFYKPSNTGRLILQSFPSAGVSEWQRLSMTVEFEALLQQRPGDACLVFPEAPDYSHRMVRDVSDLSARPLFIIPDGTWRQARRIFRHSAYLQDLPVIEPEVLQHSRYFLRKSDTEHHLCTAEVAVALLEQLGDREGAEVLIHNFRLFNEGYYASKGRNLQVAEAPPA